MRLTAIIGLCRWPTANIHLSNGSEAIAMSDTNIGNGLNEGNLNGDERLRLEALERRVEEYQASSLLGGRALRDIRDARLYRDTHKTFEDYVEERFDMTRGHAYNLIAAVGAAESLAADGIKVENEFQLRPLVKLDAEQRTAAWRMADAAANGGRVTHRLVKEAVDELTGKKQPVQFAAPKVVGGTAPSRSGAPDAYWAGAPADHVGKIEAGSVDLLLIGDLRSSHPTKAAAEFGELLDAAVPSLKASHHVLVFCRFADYRPFVAAAEGRGYEFGVPLVLSLGKGRLATAFSYRNEMQFVLHFRRGDAVLRNAIGNVFDARENDQVPGLGLPLLLIEELIDSAVAPGAVVLDPTASAAATVGACRRIGRRGVGIQPRAELYERGLEWLKSA
jgi:hypothetical protein